MGIHEVRCAVRDAVADVDGIGTAYEYRPTTFTTSPLVYVDTPSYERTRMGRGAGATPVTMTFEVVLIVAGTWDRSAQKTLDELMPAVYAGLEADRTLDGTVGSCAVMGVRGLKARQQSAEGGEIIGPVGAVYDLQVETTL